MTTWTGSVVRKPTLHITNAASRKLHHGHVWTIMAAPRAQYGEAGEGSVEDLVPILRWVQEAKAGDEAALGRYREAFTELLGWRIARLRPGSLIASPRGAEKMPVADGDTLICCCSRAAAAKGRCHRVWATEALVRAGWRVVLDGKEM